MPKDILNSLKIKNKCMKFVAIFSSTILVSFQSFALPICLQEIESTTTAVRPVAPFGASNSHQDGFDLILEMDQPNCIKIRKFKPFSKMIAKGKCSKTFNVVRLRDYFPRPPPNFD
jgi:hypothetical protein